jgi:predicted type IV restriction endonuclease
MLNKEEVKSKLKELVDRFASASKNKDYVNGQNEEWVKWNYIEPLLEMLGWKKQDIEKEARILKGRADYILKVGNEELAVVEAKKVGTTLTEDEGRQAVSYAYHRNIKFAILTNFKEIRVYHALTNIKTIDKNLLKLKEGSYFRLNFDQFLDRLDELLLLSKDSFENKEINKLLSKKDERLAKPIDKSILEDLLQFREWLSKDLKKVRTQLTEPDIDEIVQILIDRLIFMRSVEDRGLEPKNFLLGMVGDFQAGRTDKRLWELLKQQFKIFNKQYDSKLFEEGLLEKEGFFDEQTLTKVIKGLYFGTVDFQQRYQFDEIPGDLLGNIYEQYLGTILQGTEKRVKLEEKSGKRKKMGIYYTPSYIVDYIVKNTVGGYIKDKNIDEILDVKIVDPACGSGSFIVRAFQEVCAVIEKKLKAGEKAKSSQFQFYKENRLSLGQKASILTNCI